MAAFISSFETWLWSLKDKILYIQEEQGLIIVLFFWYTFLFSFLRVNQAFFVSVNHAVVSVLGSPKRQAHRHFLK